MTDTESRLTIIEDGPISSVRFLDQNILEENSIQKIGAQILQLIDQTINPKLLMDFQNVEHLSSAALGTLITINNRIKEKGGQLRLVNINPQIYEVFAITKLDKLFKIYEDSDKACASFS